MNIIAATLRGTTAPVPAGRLVLPEAHGGPLEANVSALDWGVTPVTTDQMRCYLNMADQLGGRFGSVFFNADDSVRSVVRASSREIALEESERVVDNLRMSGIEGVSQSGVTKLMPTVEEWEQRFSVLPEGGRLFLGAHHPTVFVTWLEAVCFADTVGGRLPTESEWHYAALGGRQADTVEVDDSKTSNKTVKGQSEKGTAPVIVGTDEDFAARRNGYGLLDMTENVLEWQGNREFRFHRPLFGSPGSGFEIVIYMVRGGRGDYGIPGGMSVQPATGNPHHSMDYYIGFRVVSTPEGSN